MDLKWALVAWAGVLALIGVVAVAWLIPVTRAQRRLRPLANIDRLTRLPEYQRLHRRRVVSLAIAAALLVVTFLSAMVAAARPVKPITASDGFDASNPRDIMLCVGQPVTDPTTADFFNYYADQAQSFTNEALGVTSDTLRVMPLSRDHAFVEERLRYLASLAQIQQQLDTNQGVSTEKKLELASGLESFSRPIKYVDYAPSLEDALAFCMAAFDSSGGKNHRRQLVYIGNSYWRAPDEKRPSLYDRGAIEAMVKREGIQVNAISRADVEMVSQDGNDTLRRLAEASGGTFALYNPAGTSKAQGGANTVLNTELDKITANPPQAVYLGLGATSSRTFDAPRVALSIAVIGALILASALAVLRR